MRVRFRICGDDGWKIVIANAKVGDDEECYALPRGSDRFAFWENKIGHALPRARRAMIWETMHCEASGEAGSLSRCVETGSFPVQCAKSKEHHLV